MSSVDWVATRRQQLLTRKGITQNPARVQDLTEIFSLEHGKLQEGKQVDMVPRETSAVVEVKAALPRAALSKDPQLYNPAVEKVSVSVQQQPGVALSQQRMPFLTDLDQNASPATRHLANEFGRLENLVNNMEVAKPAKGNKTKGTFKPYLDQSLQKAAAPLKAAAPVIAISLDGGHQTRQGPVTETPKGKIGTRRDEVRHRAVQGEAHRSVCANSEQRGLAKWGNARSRSRGRATKKTIPAAKVRALSTLIANQPRH